MVVDTLVDERTLNPNPNPNPNPNSNPNSNPNPNPNSNPNSNPDQVDERTLREIYLAAFEPAVRRARPWTVMAAYNRLLGVYRCSNPYPNPYPYPNPNSDPKPNPNPNSNPNPNPIPNQASTAASTSGCSAASCVTNGATVGWWSPTGAFPSYHP
eukprot:scaffold45052_cov51-Phaeocystis_antarctica.AAC.1